MKPTEGRVSHEVAAKQIPAVALGLATDDEREAIITHAERCRVCGPELERLRLAAAKTAYLLAPIEGGSTGEQTRRRLLTRAQGSRPVAFSVIDALVDEGTPTVLAETRRKWWAVDWPVIAAMALMGLGLTIPALRSSWRERETLASSATLTQEAVAQYNRMVDSLRGVILEQERATASITGPAVRIVELIPPEGRLPNGRIFWDEPTGRWTVYAHALRKPPDQRYQVWLLTATDTIAFGDLTPDAYGEAVLRANAQLSPAAFRAVTITSEPLQGSPKPTGPTILWGVPRR